MQEICGPCGDVVEVEDPHLPGAGPSQRPGPIRLAGGGSHGFPELLGTWCGLCSCDGSSIVVERTVVGLRLESFLTRRKSDLLQKRLQNSPGFLNQGCNSPRPEG